MLLQAVQVCQRAGQRGESMRTRGKGRRALWAVATACAKALGQEGAWKSRHCTKGRLCDEQRARSGGGSGQGWASPGREGQVQSLSHEN